jgi:signal transduction histidine kinase/DNA-binding NarL/FixJ family response regulator
MLLNVREIRLDGLVLVAPDATTNKYWLPAFAQDTTVPSWEEFRDTAEPGMAVSVAQVDSRFTSGDEHLQVVTMRSEEARRLCYAWKGEVHGLKIESLSKTLILGRIGLIEAVMERDEYAKFLNRFLQNDHIQDHGALAVGDVIAGVFKAEHGPRGRVVLSFQDALDVLEREIGKSIGAQPRQAAELTDEDTAEPEQSHGPLFCTPPEALSPLLLVENDEFCRGTWQDILVRAGIKVHSCASIEEAEEAITSPGTHYRMAIVDVHLTPNTNDYLGLDLARSLVGAQPGCRIVLTSAENGAKYKKELWGDFPVHGYIEKPVLLDEWAAMIDAAASSEAPSALRAFFRDIDVNSSMVRFDTTDDDAVQPLMLVDALNAFHREAPGVIAHMFRVHRRSWRGRSVVGVGATLNWEPFRGKLGKSLIRDAAETTDAIVDNNVENDWRHTWTRKMTQYRSFWGRRLPVPGHYRHVLVAFHPEPGFFSTEMQLRAEHCAEKLTRILSSQQLERRSIHDSQQTSAGLGFACLAHEIYSKLTAMAAAVKTMSDVLALADRPLCDESIAQIRNNIARLVKYVPGLVDNARILRGPAGGDKPVSVVYCLEKAVMGIREAGPDLLKHPDNLDIQLDPVDANHEWLISANASALVTVFFNVLLNAVQQIEMHSIVRRKGTVRARMQHYEEAAGLAWALVFISDTGPGIHWDDWERIFDAGYTTKEDGTGLGLHICRQLLARIGDHERRASIRIVRSVLWGGTTVKIRLPLLKASGNGE